MALKITGVIILCAAGAMLGAGKAMELSKRVAVLAGLYEGVTVFGNEISFMTATMQEAFESAAKRDISGIFANSIPHIFEKGASAAMRESVTLAGLGGEEREVMLSFAKGLDGHDKESQIKNAELALLRIEKLQKDAAGRREKLFSLYCTMGLLGGAAGGIMLL